MDKQEIAVARKIIVFLLSHAEKLVKLSLTIPDGKMAESCKVRAEYIKDTVDMLIEHYKLDPRKES